MQEEYYNYNEIGGDNIKRPIVVIVIGYMIGIIWGLYFHFSIVFLYILITCIYVLKKCYKSKTYKEFKLLSIHRYFRYIKLVFTKKVISLILISSVISNFNLFIQENRYKNIYPEEFIKVEGIIVSNSEEKEYKKRYKLKVVTVNQSNTCASTLIYIDVKKDVVFQYGDKVSLQGEFKKGNEKRNTGGFDYQLYLKSIQIYGILNVKAYKKISSNNIKGIPNMIHTIRLKIAQNIEKVLKNEDIAIVKGLILGNAKDLDEKQKEKFQVANISHVLAVSGMHIMYIITGIEIFFRKWLGKRSIKYLIIIALVFYMSITGFTSSIVRAGIMGIMSMIAFLVCRKNDIWTAIAISLGGILIQNPYAVTNIGLQLSYLGTIGIILFHKNVKQYLADSQFFSYLMSVTKKQKICKIIENVKDMIAVTMSAQIMIFPVMLYHFNMMGIYFMITNILVSIIIEIVMVLSVIFILSSFIHVVISKWIAIFLSMSIQILIQIANFADLPFSKIYVATPNIVGISIYYIVILIGNVLYKIYKSIDLNNTEKRIKNLIALGKYKLYEKKKFMWKTYKKAIQNKNIKLYIPKICMIIVLILFLINRYQFHQNLKIHFLDVGQGDACFIITPNRKTILIDGGGSNSNTFDVGKDILIPYILDRGYTKIDYVFISHFDQDHSLGCAKIIENLTVSNLILNKQLEENDIYKHIVSIAKQKKVNLIYVKAGDVITLNGVKIKILHPQEKLIAENSINNNSIVFKLEYKSFSILFTGDIENIAEEVILSKNINLKADILKVAHHGSKTSSSQRFIEAVSPKIALIGVGKNNMFGHPNREVIERLQSYGTKIYRTDECGEISITVNNRGKIVGIKKCIK